MKKFVLAIDQGTTSSRAILFDRDSNPVAVAQREFAQYCPQDGWVEHDAEEILATTLAVVREALAKSGATLEEIAAVGITNQRETTVVWERATGKPIYRAVCWQSRQSQAICEELAARGLAETIRRKTGLPIDPYFSGSKIRWILDRVDGARERAARGELMFGTVDAWLIWNLTRGAVWATDYSNASRTMLFDVRELKWDAELLAALDVPARILPEVRSTSGDFGFADLLVDPTDPPGTKNNVRVPIASAVGDQQAALFGQCCFERGDVKCTYGTGCFMLTNVGNVPVESENGLLTTIAWKLEGEPVEYALEGSVFVGGAAVQWLRDGLRLFEKSSDCEESAKDADGSAGVYVVPAFVGLGAPYWDDDARGAVFGITRATTREHLINATVESIAFQCADLANAMQADSGAPIRILAVDGGASANDWLTRFQADLLDRPVARPVCLESTALGAAYLAGLAVGFWKDKDEIRRFRRLDRTFVPEMKPEERERRLAGWRKAVEATRVFKPERRQEVN